MTDDRGDYFQAVLEQTAAIAEEYDETHVKQHLERHGFTPPDN